MTDRRAARRTPQEKKQLSYPRDRRNNYGENDKSSRSSIRLRKRLVNRVNRHRDQQILGDITGHSNTASAESIEQMMLGRRRPRWRKAPDVALGAHVEASLSSRKQNDPGPDQSRIKAGLGRLRRHWTRRSR